MSEFIRDDALCKTFGGFTAVDSMSLSVHQGQVLGFLGPNGAGKTTTMRMLTGFIEPDAGTAAICGINVFTDPIAAKKHMGYLPEGAPLYGDMTVRQFLAFIGEVRRLSTSQYCMRLEAVVTQLHLDEVLDQTIETLSKGSRPSVGSSRINTSGSCNMA